MTFAVYIVIFGALIFGLLFLLPDATALPSEFYDGLYLIVGYIKAWDGIFAISSLIQALYFVVLFSTFIYLVKISIWIIGFFSAKN